MTRAELVAEIVCVSHTLARLNQLLAVMNAKHEALVSQRVALISQLENGEWDEVPNLP